MLGYNFVDFKLIYLVFIYNYVVLYLKCEFISLFFKLV